MNIELTNEEKDILWALVSIASIKLMSEVNDGMKKGIVPSDKQKLGMRVTRELAEKLKP